LTDGQDGITPILEVSGAITFNSSSAGILPTGTSSITGSLIRAATTLATISSSITPSDTTGFTVNAVGSSSLSVSSSWQLTADKDGTPIGYNFKFFSGSVGNYTQVGAQPFNINIDGKDGPPGSGSIVFSVTPATQVICRDINDTITDVIPSVQVTAQEGQQLLAYNNPNPGIGEWNFIQLYGIPSQSATPVMTFSSFGGGAGGRINFDHTQIAQTGSGQFIAYAEIRYTSSLNTTGSVTESFTLTKQNCYDPCSPSVVELSSYNQTVNSIEGSLQASPTNFSAIVTQDGDQLTYQSGVTSESTFDYLSISQFNAVGPATDNGDGTITPADPSTLNTSEVHTLVRYKDNCGITATFPTTHSINVIFEGSVGPGVVVTGIWTGSQAYVTQNNESGGIRDVVLWWTPAYAAESGSVPGDPLSFNGYPIDEADTEEYMISYYAAIKTHTSVLYDDTNSGSLGPPHISTGSLSADPAWEYLGDEERFVAAKIGIFRESFIWNTLNIGTNATTQGDLVDNVKANITLAGGTNTPYISIGQTTQDYGEAGTFIGSGSAAKLSLSGSSGHLLWDGSTLNILGDISASNGYFSGSLYANDGNFAGDVIVGDNSNITIGPNAVTSTPIKNTMTNGTSVPLTAQYDPSSGTGTDFTFETIIGTFSAGQHTVGDSVELRVDITDAVTDVAPSPGNDYIEIITSTLKVTQGSTTTDVPLGTHYVSDGNESVAYTGSYTSLTEGDQISVSLETRVEGSENQTNPPLTSWFTASMVATQATPIIVLNSNGIFYDAGDGPRSVININNSVTSGGSGTGGNVSNTGTPLNNQLAVWTDATTVEGDADLTWDGSTLDVTGTVDATIDVVVSSDIRLKNVESYVSGGLIIVNNLTPIKYTWKDNKDSKLHIGLSAQEVLKYVPEAVYGSEESKYGISYGKLVPVLIDAVKELTTRIEELEKQLEDRD